MIRFSRIPPLAVLALTLITACTSTKELTEKSPGASGVQITVHNDNVLDVTVYALRGAERIRLGMITSGSRKVFTLKDDIIVNAPVIRFVADPIGSARLILIDELPVFPGHAITLWVPSRRLDLTTRAAQHLRGLQRTPFLTDNRFTKAY